MNKKIIVLLALLVITVFVGCSGSVNADNSIPVESEKFEMDLVDQDIVNWVGDCYLYEDKETTVEYIVFYNSGYVSITPRYNADGTLKTHNQ